MPEQSKDYAPLCDRAYDGECSVGLPEWRSFYSNLLERDKSYWMCDRHWEKFVWTMQEIESRYPKQQPADFDPTYAGERWDEDD